MREAIEEGKASFLRAKDRLVRALANTPDDRLNWSPSPSARSPLHVAAHSADAIRNIHNMLDGRPFPVPTSDEADVGFREWEKQFTTREQVTALLDEVSDAYVAWLDALGPSRLDDRCQLPFGLGFAPLRMVLSAQAAHLDSHTPQIEYIQTIYGDRDWHM
jgi:hypothetical protein